jgi:glutathionyl-hydroquinone reductase
MTKDGWHFSTSEEAEGCIADSVNNAKFIREIYFKANPDYSGRFTVYNVPSLRTPARSF